MSDNLNQQFNDFRISQMDQMKGMSQFMQNPSGNDDFVSNNSDLFNYFNLKNSNNENADNYLNAMDYYNNIPAPSLDKNQKNFSDFDQMQGTQEDMIKMMEKLNIDPNNENLFNPISNNNLGANQMRGGQIDQMKQWEDDDESAFNLNQALNQLSQNQNNQFGNINNISDNLGNIMNNEKQNKMKSNRNQNKKNNLQQNTDNQMNIFNQLNPYMNFNNPLMKKK